MRFLRIALLLFLLALPVRLGLAALPEFLPPETKVVVGISLRGLIDSPLLAGAAGAADAKTTMATLLAGSPLAGLDPLKDIDDLIAASTGEGANAPALIVLRGRFPAQLISAANVYRGVPIFEAAKTPNGTVALLDNNTLLAGDLKMVHDAIDRRGQTTRLDPALVERIHALESRFDFWGVGDLPGGAPAAAPAALQAIDHFEFGASLRHGLEVSGQIHVRASKEAEIMQSFQFLEAMLKAQQSQPSPSGAKFDVQSDHGTFKFSIAIPEEELRKAIVTQKANFTSALASAPKSEAPKMVVITAPPTPGSIVKNQRGDAVTVTLPRKE